MARQLKAIPETSNFDLKSLKPILREWHRLALPFINTKNFDETWADFANSWANVKFPAGQEPIQQIFNQAIAKPPPEAAGNYDSQELKELVALCLELQIAAGPMPFFLDCRTAGQLVGVSHVVANKWLRLLCFEKVLEVAVPGRRHRATEFRYIADRR